MVQSRVRNGHYTIREERGSNLQTCEGIPDMEFAVSEEMRQAVNCLRLYGRQKHWDPAWTIYTSKALGDGDVTFLIQSLFA